MQQLVNLLYKGRNAFFGPLTGSRLFPKFINFMPSMIPDWFLRQEPAVQIAATLATGAIIYKLSEKFESQVDDMLSKKKSIKNPLSWIKTFAPAMTLITATRLGMVPKEYQNITTGMIVAGTVGHKIYNQLTIKN